MKDFFLNMKEKFMRPAVDDDVEEYQSNNESYVEVGSEQQVKNDKSKVLVRQFVMDEFEDIKEVLDVLRVGNTIALINIKPLKEKDIVELKRAVSKLRKTCTAIDGDIAGVSEDFIVAVPYFAKIFRPQRDIKEDSF
jgi:SepF-like predicted cell division protein (DUF552 family)